MSVDLEAVRERVEAMPWVDQARVQRRWPHGLRIEVTEQVAAARWGESGLLNTRGELFSRTRATCRRNCRDSRARRQRMAGRAALPQRAGPPDRGRHAPRRARARCARRLAARARAMASACGSAAARSMNASIASFRPRSPVMSGRAAEIDYVDMRYSNGFAIGWKRSARTREPRQRRQNAPTPSAPRSPA